MSFPQMTLAAHWVIGDGDDRGGGPKENYFLCLKFQRFRTLGMWKAFEVKAKAAFLHEFHFLL